MPDETFSYALLGALAIALLTAAFTDLAHRRIANWLNAGIALGAPLFWLASGLSLWPDIALQLGLALATFAVLAGLFALGAIGGGDVKLLTGLALWIAPGLFAELLLWMALLGGVLTFAFIAWKVFWRPPGRLTIPYGVAIAFAGLIVLTSGYVPAATAARVLALTAS